LSCCFVPTDQSVVRTVANYWISLESLQQSVWLLVRLRPRAPAWVVRGSRFCRRRTLIVLLLGLLGEFSLSPSSACTTELEPPLDKKVRANFQRGIVGPGRRSVRPSRAEGATLTRPQEVVDSPLPVRRGRGRAPGRGSGW